MRKRRVLLFSACQLLGESLAQTLRQVEDLELSGPIRVDERALERLSSLAPDVVMITDEALDEEAVSRLTTQILNQRPDLPVLWVSLDHSVLRVHSWHTLPARSADLLELIRQMTLDEPDGERTHRANRRNDPSEKEK